MSTPSLGLQLYTVRTVDLAIEALLEQVAGAGYHGVETVGTQGVEAARLRRALDDSGLVVASAHVPLTELRSDLQALCTTHRTLGTPLLVMPWLEHEERPSDLSGWAALGRELGGYGRSLAEEGFDLAYHHHDFELQRHADADGLTALLDAAPAEHLTLELDTGWLQAVGEDPLVWLRRWGSRTTRLHLKDLVRGNDPPWVDVGDGELDLGGVLATAEAIGIPWLLVEHDEPSDPLVTMWRGAAATLKALRQSCIVRAT
jgi:sugar phosphate isomerase/epimerase